jgi:hypothetical protein
MEAARLSTLKKRSHSRVAWAEKIAQAAFFAVKGGQMTGRRGKLPIHRCVDYPILCDEYHNHRPACR